MSKDEILEKIGTYLEAAENSGSSLIPVPSLLLKIGGSSRRGLSTIRSVSKVCEKLEEEGITTSANPDGTPNLVVKFVNIIIDEIYRAIAEDAKVEAAAAMGSVTVQTAGTAVAQTGTNILPFSVDGIVR